MNVPISVVAFAIITVLMFRLLRTGRRASGLPPGPPTVPILGNLHLMPVRDVHLQFQRWAHEYGSVYSLVFGTKTVVVLSSAEAVRDLLDKRSAIYSDRQDHYLAGTILSGGNRMLMMHYGQPWRMIRKLVHSCLNSQKSASYVSYPDLESKQMLFETLSHPDRLLDSMRRYSMSVAMNISYGLRTISFDDPRQEELYQVDKLAEVAQSATSAFLEAFPLLRSLPDVFVPTKKLAREQHKRELKFFMSMWLNVKQDVKSGKAKTSLSRDMVSVQGKERFSDELAAYISGSVLEAGVETTSNTLYAWIQAMILFPDVQKQAREFIDEVASPQRLPVIEDYPRLPYIRNCIKEATRWFPTAILGFPHAVMEDDEYLGYRIPKGTGIINNVYTIHMDPDRYHEPHRFNPDRFKHDEQSLVEATTNSAPDKRASFAFGAGRRICQGTQVAETSLFLGISRILWAFDILPPKDERGNEILPDPTKITQGFVCMPEKFSVILKPRSVERVAVIEKMWDAAQAELDPDSKQWK